MILDNLFREVLANTAQIPVFLAYSSIKRLDKERDS